MSKHPNGFLFAITIALCSLTFSGCTQPEDLVKVPVPREVQKATGAPATVPLSAFRDIRDEYEAKVKAEAQTKAEEAAATARALTSLTRTTQARYSRIIAEAQAEAEAELQSLQDDAESKQAEIQAAMNRITSGAQQMASRMGKLQEQAEARAESIRTILSFGLNEVAPGIAAQFPGVGLAVPLLTGVIGLMTKKPGDAAKTQKAIKDAADLAYDQGMAAARGLMPPPKPEA